MERCDKEFACFIVLGIMYTHEKLVFPLTSQDFDLVGGGGGGSCTQGIKSL